MLDRIAVTVGNDAITESEVLEEIRVTALLNSQPVDFSPAARRAAAERLVDQYLIRRELASGTYSRPDAAQAERVLAEFIKTHSRNRAEFQALLKQYGVAEAELKDHLLFQLTALQFTQQRFGGAAPAAAPPARNEAERAAPGADVDQQLDQWLKDQRKQARVEFKKEAFE